MKLKFGFYFESQIWAGTSLVVTKSCTETTPSTKHRINLSQKTLILAIFPPTGGNYQYVVIMFLFMFVLMLDFNISFVKRENPNWRFLYCYVVSYCYRAIYFKIRIWYFWNDSLGIFYWFSEIQYGGSNMVN